EVDQRSARFSEKTGREATLALVRGADESATAYARQIERQFTRHGLRVLPFVPDVADLLTHLRGLSANPLVDGVLLMTPLPAGVDAESAALAIDPSKDVDGQHPFNIGRLAQRRHGFAPATALGGLRLLQHYGVALRGTRAAVVGRSPVVGMPLA